MALPFLIGGPAYADDAAIDRAALKLAFQSYGSCNQDCAESLAVDILDEGVNTGLGAVGAIKLTNASDIVKYATFYALIRSIVRSGEKIVDNNKACYTACDALNKEIVALGSAGLLGPMLKGGKIDESALTNQKIIDAYQKFIKPTQLPAEEKGPNWDKYIKSLG
jgi:hypothetical protein